MTPVIPSQTHTISLIHWSTLDTKKTKNGSIKCFYLKKSTKRTLNSQDFIKLPLSTSLRLFPNIKTFRVNLAVKESDQLDSSVSGQDSGQTSEPKSTVEKSKQRSRPVRKREMPPVKDEELVPGANFTGKIRSVQPFGAFVDFGAFTDGLVHVSRLSDGYVKDIATLVSVGQQVKVKLVEANIETGRIALTMRESQPVSKTGQKSNEGRKSTKFVKGQDLEGTVKNLTRSGAFINLPEGSEGFLPASEESDEGFGSLMSDGSSLEIGQIVKVRVLRVAKGQLTLTMKKDEDNKVLDSKLNGTVFTATNPFLVAFRKNEDIGSFLDEREKVKDEKVTLVSDEETESENTIKDEDEKIEPVSDENGSIASSSEQVDVSVIEETEVGETVDNQIEESETKVEVAQKVEVAATEQIAETAVKYLF